MNYSFYNNITFKKIILYFYILIIFLNLSSSSTIKIPFKITQHQNALTNKEETTINNLNFYIKLISFIELGNPIQKIETIYEIRDSNFYISNYCYNCSYFYSNNKSTTFHKANIDKRPKGLSEHYYAYETFYFYDGINKQQKEANDILISLSGFNNEKNILTIGLKFPNIYYNDYQESFIQQLKHKNIINQYFWTIVLNDNNNINKINNEFDGFFIFGDILNDYYPYINNYSPNKIVYTYTANKNNKMNLEWGLIFDSVYYKIPISNSNLNSYNYKTNIVNIVNLISEFDLNLNIIFGTYEYSRNIKRDYFQIYFIKNICHSIYMKGGMFKYIYCHARNFTENDIKKFPTLYFKNIDLNFAFSLDYNDLFYLSQDKQYYIFNIMITDIYNLDAMDEDELDGTKWIFGLPFLKKYQFSFDSDNKLIYFFNKNGIFLNDDISKGDEDDVIYNNEKYEKVNNDSNKNNTIKKKDNKYYSIEIKKIIVFIVLTLFFISLFFILVLIIKKILFKKGFVLIRVKKANELNEEEYYDYSSKNINFLKDENDKNKEVEMHIQKYN